MSNRIPVPAQTYCYNILCRKLLIHILSLCKHYSKSMQGHAAMLCKMVILSSQNNSLFLQNVLMESIHTFGLSLMIVKVLPSLDLIRCLLIMCGVGLVPALLNLIFGLRPKNNTGKKACFIIFDILAVIFQLSCLLVILLLDFTNSPG